MKTAVIDRILFIGLTPMAFSVEHGDGFDISDSSKYEMLFGFTEDEMIKVGLEYIIPDGDSVFACWHLEITRYNFNGK